MATQQAQRRQDFLILCCAALCCAALPLVAQSKLDRKVHVELAAAVSEAIGAPVELGRASVGLTGTLEISNLRVADYFSAERVIASVSPARFGPRRLAANEILIESPRAQIRIDKEGNSNLDNLLATRRRVPSSSVDTKGVKGKASLIEQIQLVNGSVDIELIGRGSVHATQIDIQMRGDKVHGTAGDTEVAMLEKGWSLEGTLPQAAFDYQRHGEGLQRVLAYGGALRVTGPEGRAMLQELMVSYRIGVHEWQISARTGVNRPTGSLLLQASREAGGVTMALEAKDAPLTLAGPWLPSQVRPEHTLVSGTVIGSKGQAVHADVALSFAKLEIAESGFSKRPMRLDLEVEGSASVRRTQDSYFVASKLRSLKSAELEVSGAASGQWQPGSPFPRVGKLELQLAEVDCAAALNALPDSLRPMLAGLELRGVMKSQLKLAVSKDRPEETSLEVNSGIDACQVVREPPSANTKALLGDYEHRGPDGQTLLLTPGTPGFTAIREMPKYVPRAFVAAEDSQFFSHNGFDPHQIARSLAIDVEQGRFARGGSTISQQLIKNLYLHRKRTLGRKLQEAILTWRLESNVPKERILEIYLNIIEFGDQGTYGITAGAQRWFGVHPKDLSILQTAFLAAIIPEPTSMSSRIREAKGLDATSNGRVEVILRAMRRGRVISNTDYQKAMRRKLTFVPSAYAAGPGEDSDAKE